MSIFGKTDAERKACPVLDGAVMYFPRALAAIARHSAKANEKHNPGEPLHWAKHKSTDQLNTAVRHIIDFKMGVLDDGEYDNLTAAGWRVLAALETELERREQAAAVWLDKMAQTRDECTDYQDKFIPSFAVPTPEMYAKLVADIIQRPIKPLAFDVSETTACEPGRHCIPSGSNWLPSDNCYCDTCRFWRRDKLRPQTQQCVDERDTLRSRNKYPNAAAVNTAIDQATAQTATSMAGAICAAPESAWRRQCFDIRCVLDVNHWGLCRAGNGDGIYGDGISADTAKG